MSCKWRSGIMLLSAGWLAVLVELASDTGIGLGGFWMTIFGTGAVAAVCAISEAAGYPTSVPLRRWVLWSPIPVVAAGVITIFLSSQTPINPLFFIRFTFSKNALDRSAAAYIGTETNSTQQTWIGLFHVRHIAAYHDSVRLITVGCGVIDQCGLAFLPNGPPKGVSKSRLKSIVGPWYLLYEVF